MFRTIFTLMFLASHALGWQDDLEIMLRDPFAQFYLGKASFLSQATAQVRLGRYLVASSNHGWSGGVEGDIALINFTERLLWHMGLNMETLADNQNDIHFRLVQVYYQGLMGLKFRLGNGVFDIGYSHRCSHGTDNAAKSRIIIRSGPFINFDWVFKRPKFEVQLASGLSVYAVGQNSDLDMQPRGGAFFSWQGLVPMNESLSLLMSVGARFEVVNKGQKWVYFMFDRLQGYIEPLVGARVGIRLTGPKVKSDIDIRLSQYLDSGIGKAETTNALSVTINFWW